MMNNSNLPMIFLVAALPLADACGGEAIQVSPVTVLLIDHRDVAAADSGRLESVTVSEGESVVAGQRIAALDSSQQALAVETAELNHRAALFQSENSLPVDTAQAALEVATKGLGRIQATLDIAQQQANETFGIQIAETERDAAKAELDRAIKARTKHRLSVSDSQFEQLQAVARKGELQVEQARSDHTVTALQPLVHAAEREEQRASIARFELLLKQERHNTEFSRMTVDAKLQDVTAARLLLEQRFVNAPLSGVVAEVHRRPGEWVDKGTAILKIINLNKLRLEGFVEARHVTKPLVGSDVSIRFPTILPDAESIRGVVTYVVPEVDPVNQRVRVWAEFDNPDLLILPGMAGEMTIDVSSSAAQIGSRSPIESR
ncbi:MAG: efflux RND transporter periplasmic adaptor subunit [Planctomycetaceae bacterium]